MLCAILGLFYFISVSLSGIDGKKISIKPEDWLGASPCWRVAGVRKGEAKWGENCVHTSHKQMKGPRNVVGAGDSSIRNMFLNMAEEVRKFGCKIHQQAADEDDDGWLVKSRQLREKLQK